MSTGFIPLEKIVPMSTDADADVADIDPDPGQKLYQLQPRGRGKTGAILRWLGHFKERTTVVLQEFRFKGYDCQIVSYLLSDVDLEFADDRCELKMMSLLLKRGGGVSVAVTMSFYTFVHRRERRSIAEYVSRGEADDIVLPGFFGYQVKSCASDPVGVPAGDPAVVSGRVGNLLEVFPGKSRCIKDLIEILSDDKLSPLFTQ